jgi:ribonuclease HII
MEGKSKHALSIGIDEAGRGCVIGPMVVADVAADDKDRRWFWDQNVRDSKLVPPAQRDKLAKAIMERCWFQIKVTKAPQIDAAVRDRSRTLNGLELELMTECLQDAMDEYGDREAYAVIDAPSINAQGFLEKIYQTSGWGEMDRLVAKHHADKKDRTVGAASIIAKYERERLIAKLKIDIGCDFGSGYCHDPRTKAYMKKAPQGALWVRWSWATARALVE